MPGGWPRGQSRWLAGQRGKLDVLAECREILIAAVCAELD
jgi:hypothetical protein